MSEKVDVETPAKSRDSGGFVWPVLLIGVGVLFLLDNLNVINFDFWYAASRLWPVVLIAIGLDMLIGRRSWLISLFIGVITVGMLVAGLFWLGAGGGRGEPISETISRSLEGADAGAIVIDFPVGELHLDALPSSSDELISGQVNLPGDGFRIEQSYEVDNGVARFELQTEGSGGPSDLMQMRGDDWRWELHLTPNVPLDLTISTGVGQSNLDLRQLNLSNLEVDSGVGETRISLPGEGQLAARIEGGIGEVVVEIPEGVAARITGDTGIGEMDIDDDFVREGDAYVSGNYDDALDRIELHISAGIGRVEVRTYSGR